MQATAPRLLSDDDLQRVRDEAQALQAQQDTLRASVKVRAHLNVVAMMRETHPMLAELINDHGDDDLVDEWISEHGGYARIANMKHSELLALQRQQRESPVEMTPPPVLKKGKKRPQVLLTPEDVARLAKGQRFGDAIEYIEKLAIQFNETDEEMKFFPYMLVRERYMHQPLIHALRKIGVLLSDAEVYDEYTKIVDECNEEMTTAGSMDSMDLHQRAYMPCYAIPRFVPGHREQFSDSDLDPEHTPEERKKPGRFQVPHGGRLECASPATVGLPEPYTQNANEA